MSPKLSSLAFDDVKERIVRASIVEVDFAQEIKGVAHERIDQLNNSFSDEIIEIGGRVIVSF